MKIKPESDKINFAVIGYGHIGKRHAQMIMSHEEARLVGIVDTACSDTITINCPKIPLYNSLNALFQSGNDIDVVSIATPNGFHALHAFECLDAGKHIVIEKPMTLNRQDAESVIYKALNLHKHVFVVMQNRYSPPSVWIKKLVESKRLGNIYMVQLCCYWNRDEQYYHADSWHGKKELDGGTLFTQFSHFIDIMYWLFGDIKNIQTRMRDFNHQQLTEFEDSGFISFDFVNGGIGCINFSTSVWECNMESSMTIIAENGSIKIGGQYMDKVEYCHVKDYQMPILAATNAGNDYGTYKGSAQNHHFVINNVVDVLKARSCITTNALEGLKVVDIIERIYASAH